MSSFAVLGQAALKKPMATERSVSLRQARTVSGFALFREYQSFESMPIDIGGSVGGSPQTTVVYDELHWQGSSEMVTLNAKYISRGYTQTVVNVTGTAYITIEPVDLYMPFYGPHWYPLSDELPIWADYAFVDRNATLFAADVVLCSISDVAQEHCARGVASLCAEGIAVDPTGVWLKNARIWDVNIHTPGTAALDQMTPGDWLSYGITGVRLLPTSIPDMDWDIPLVGTYSGEVERREVDNSESVSQA